MYLLLRQKKTGKYTCTCGKQSFFKKTCTNSDSVLLPSFSTGFPMQGAKKAEPGPRGVRFGGLMAQQATACSQKVQYDSEAKEQPISAACH